MKCYDKSPYEHESVRKYSGSTETYRPVRETTDGSASGMFPTETLRSGLTGRFPRVDGKHGTPPKLFPHTRGKLLVLRKPSLWWHTPTLQPFKGAYNKNAGTGET